MKISRNGNGIHVICPRCGGNGPTAPSAIEAFWLAAEQGWRSMLTIGRPPQFICRVCVKVGTLK